MKKIITAVILLFTVTAFVSAQNKALEKWADKINAQSSNSISEHKSMHNVIKEAGFYLEKSAKYQYAAIIISGIGTGLAITGSFLDDKVETINDEPGIEIKKNNLRTVCLVGAGACIVTAICCEIASVNYKLKAGKSLRLFSTGTGGGLAYVF